MKKFVLGACAALPIWTAAASAQTPAPIVPANVEMPSGMPVGNVGQAGAMDYLTTPRADYGNAVGYGGGMAPSSRFYTEASYLLMFVDSAMINQPLLTNGLAGRSGTSVLAGNNETSYGTSSGFRVSVGGLVGGNSIGFDLNAMYIGRVSDTQTFGPQSASVFARPFFDTSLRSENAKAIASPGAFTGAMTIDNSFSAWGAEFNPFYRVVQGNSVSLDVITGFRYFSIDEGLNIYDSTRVLASGTSAFNGIGLGAGSLVITHDKFSVRNNFYGGNVGGRISFSRGSFFLDASAKIAVGGIHQVVNVDGSTTLAAGGGLVGPATTPGGFLANPAYTGDRTENRFAVLPEGNLTLGYQMSSWLNVFAGYQVLYLNNVARPQEQISRDFTATNLATTPTYSARGLTSRNVDIASSDIFIHGFSFGFTITY